MTHNQLSGAYNRAHGRDRMVVKPREIEIDSASVIRGSPEHRVPCVTSKVHGPRSSEPSCLRVNTRAHPSNEPIGAPLVVTRFFRHLIHLHAVIHITSNRLFRPIFLRRDISPFSSSS